MYARAREHQLRNWENKILDVRANAVKGSVDTAMVMLKIGLMK